MKTSSLSEATSQAPSKTQKLVIGEPDGRRWIAWIMKRTYRIRNGACELDEPGRQEILQRGELPYDQRKLPRIAPPFVARDLFAFRPKTDVVVQGFAHAYEEGTRTLTARVRFGKHERAIVVHGDRFGDIDRVGQPRFSEPTPIDLVPLRYDYAYGGADWEALARFGDPIGELMRDARPNEAQSPITSFHYPRNPTGFGYLMKVNPATFRGMPMPHLEHPGEPLAPARLAVHHPTRWIQGPMPACWDWQSEAWFPRLAYLGLAPSCRDDGEPCAEVVRGFAPADILTIPPIFQAPDAPLRMEHGQGASPGMSFADLAPDTYFELEHLHPNRPKYSFHMPGEVPSVRLAMTPGTWTEMSPHLDSVVVRPVPGEIVVVWSARALCPAELTLDRALDARPEVTWARKKER